MQDLAFRTNDVQSRCKVVSQDLICLKEKFSKAEEIYRESCQLVESMQLDANRQYENYLNEDKKLADEKNEVELLKNEGQMKYDEVSYNRCGTAHCCIYLFCSMIEGHSTLCCCFEVTNSVG